jgi:UDP-glucose 4-epimerase
MKKKILIIGGSGYLGSHVADYLAASGHKIIIYDIKKSPWFNPKYKFVKGDILNTGSLSKIISKVNIIYHFAAISDIEIALNNPIKTVQVNILGTLNILDLARKNSIERFIFASSIYALSSNGGFYSCSKRSSEDYIREYNKIYGLNYTILRYGSLYGIRSTINNGVHKIIAHAITENELQYLGNKMYKRRYVHVEDVAKASVQILSKKYKNTSINLMGTKLYKVIYLLKIISKLLKINNKPIFLNRKSTGHFVSKPNKYKIDKGVNYKFRKTVDLFSGIKELISEIRNNNV